MPRKLEGTGTNINLCNDPRTTVGHKNDGDDDDGDSMGSHCHMSIPYRLVSIHACVVRFSLVANIYQSL